MIATHTFNPSVDITYEIDPLVVGEVHRVKQKIENPGGKGINVTKVLHQLGAAHCAFGYLGGANGQWMADTLKEMGITSAFTLIQGQTRQSLALNDGQAQTEVLEQGPTISESEQQAYFENVTQHAADAKVMTISGSSPQFETHSKFDHMARILKAFPHTYNIVDTHAGELKALLEAKLPIHCIKPNQSEFEMLVGETQLTIDDCARLLQTHAYFSNCDVFLTLGGDGAFVKWKQGVYRATLPHKDIVNPVGSGDSTVAGIAYSVDQGLAPEALIRQALACGTSNALQEKTGFIDVNQVAEIKNEIEVERFEW
ncbi:1-phosphofructokinase family hexose kinase [Staphylococcus pseudintermedius]|uniref:1-phosphofructokinase family hexose kinase n=1 Tax=Staphylococcus pseudintermedius TaxID=283734 RepID=UPI000C71307B|nr:hexose kinase [Staphylococcus pseudintermedius]PPD65193.1 tagatose-6-phosphate kinase [Staphylococcus pseudintermedius]